MDAEFFHSHEYEYDAIPIASLRQPAAKDTRHLE